MSQRASDTVEFPRDLTKPHIDSVGELRCLLAALLASDEWWCRVQQAMVLFERTSPWPGTVPELLALVDETLTKLNVPVSRRAAARLYLLPSC